LLSHPDHYTSHMFRPCYWRGYVYEVMKAWADSGNISEEGKSVVVVGVSKEENVNKPTIVPLSPVLDYMWWPSEFENICVYN
ncbi:hypothetical protein L226DRAFT_474401, partial [Lentinus tigrinus ALCF2SS1-7]